MRLMHIGLILFAVSGVVGQPKRSSQAKPAKKPPPQIALSENSLSTSGATNEQLLRNLYLGNFADISMERDALFFGVLYSQYLNAYAQRCASSLHSDKVEITRDVCVRERYTVNGYGVRVGSAVCVEYRQEGTGLYADPAMYAAKLKLAQLAEANAWRNTMRIIGQAQDNPFAPAVEMLNTSTATEQDVNMLVQANGCKSPALRRFQENLRLYALGKQPIRLGGPKQALAAGAPASTDYRRLLEDLVFDYAKRWAMNRYVSGSVADVNVSRDELGRPLRVAARYQYVGFNGNSQGSVTLEFADGYPECMYFFDYPSVCKTPNRKIIAAYENGSYRAPEVVVKPATVVAEKRETPAPAPAPEIEAPPAPKPVAAIEESDPEPKPADFGDIEIHAEMHVRSKVRLDVQPSNALVLVREADDAFKYVGLASKYSGAERLWLDDEPQLLLLRKKGWRDRVIRLTIADDGEEIIRVSMTAETP